MTKKLEELLDLPDSKEIIKQDQKKASKEVVAQQNETLRDIAEFDKISAALPAVKGLGEMADTELNEVAQKAMDAYDDLMDLGMNVESRYSGRVFEVAGGMLKTSLDAKVATFLYDSILLNRCDKKCINRCMKYSEENLLRYFKVKLNTLQSSTNISL